jgi:SnoaL-like domain
VSMPEPKIPDADDLEANVRWLRDLELIRALPQRYAFGVDTSDFEIVRSVFHPDCTVVGTLEDGPLEPYLEGIEEGLQQWAATMHFMINQYVTVDGDTGHVETWSLAHHMEADGSPIDDLILALRYQDDVVRVGDDWKIIRRNAVKHFHRGPFPRPTIGPPAYPRPHGDASGTAGA